MDIYDNIPSSAEVILYGAYKRALLGPGGGMLSIEIHSNFNDYLTEAAVCRRCFPVLCVLQIL